MRILLCLCASFFLVSKPAYAAWHEASSEHFVIYADQSAKTVQLFAERLEKYHAAMAFMLRKEPESPSPSNRVNVFVVSNTSNVRKLADVKSKYIAGVYRPLAGNIVAIVPRLRSGGSKFTLNPEVVLRHEYAHHFLFNISSRTFPLWYQEGFAEFYASGRNERDGTVILGGAANHRAYELNRSASVSTELLLDTAAYLTKRSNKYDEFYGRSWLLYHYMTFEKSRKGQLVEYEKLLIGGKSEIDAAKEAFGDLGALHSELDRYQKRRRITAVGIPPDRLKTSPVHIRKLGKGEASMMPIIMESRTGVDDEEARELVVDARAIALRYPDDPAVLEALAETEFDAGFNDQAIAAADRALALDSKRVRAQIQKIYAYAEKAKSATNEDVAWKEVRKQIVAANKIENNHPIPLIEYYKSYREGGQQPPEIAVQGLERALQIAPFDQSLRFILASEYMDSRKFNRAAATLRPLAFNPHRSGATEAAEKMLELAKQAAIEDAKMKESNASIGGASSQN